MASEASHIQRVASEASHIQRVASEASHLLCILVHAHARGGWVGAWAGTCSLGRPRRKAGRPWLHCDARLLWRACRKAARHRSQAILFFFLANSIFVLLSLAFAGLPVRATQQGQNGNSTHPLNGSAGSLFVLLSLAFAGLARQGMPKKAKRQQHPPSKQTMSNHVMLCSAATAERESRRLLNIMLLSHV